MSEAVINAPSIGISVSYGAIVFQTFLPQDADDKTINSMLDKLAKAGARQQAKVDLVDAEKNLKVSERDLTRLRTDRTRIEASLASPQEGRRSQQRADAPKLQQQRDQADATEKVYEENIKELRAIIAKHEALIAGD